MTRPLPISERVQPEIQDEYVAMFGRLKVDEEADAGRVTRNLAQVIVNRYLDAYLSVDAGHLPPLVEEMGQELVEESDVDLLAELANRAETYIHSEVQQQRPE